MIEKLLIEYINNTNSHEANYNLGVEYQNIGQTAAAISFLLRAAELSENKLLSYECMIRIAKCFEKQKNRNNTVKSSYHNAITILPNRPEAYFFLSNFLEYEGNKFDSYTFANIGLELYEKYDIEDTNICDYPGKYGLIFQKAVTAWWRGNCMESRKIFQTLIDNHWDEMSEYHKTMVEKNVVSLGSGPPDLIFKKYDKSKHNKLRYKFKGSENIENNYSQIYQDLFILSMLNGKRNGSYLEIGGAEPYFGNNTCLLEKEFDWKGVSIEYDKKFIDRYTKERPNTNILNTDALKLDYNELLKNNFDSNIIDYLQLDIEPAAKTYECLLNIPFDEYKFAVITFEHDYYADVTRSIRDKSRDYLRSKGYVLVAGNLAPIESCPFEDWWVHPDLVDNSILQKMMQENDETKLVEEYMFSGEKITNFYINNNNNKTLFIVDNFYQNPEEVRNFALQQDKLI